MIQDKFMLLVPIAIVAIYVMGLFIDKYYHLFELRDKIIIECLKILLALGGLIYFYFDYPGSNSFFLAFLPFGILICVYRLSKMFRSKENPIIYFFKDKMIIKSLQLLGVIAMAVFYYVLNKTDSFLGFFILLIIGYSTYSFIKEYRSGSRVES